MKVHDSLIQTFMYSFKLLKPYDPINIEVRQILM